MGLPLPFGSKGAIAVNVLAISELPERSGGSWVEHWQPVCDSGFCKSDDKRSWKWTCYTLAAHPR